MLLEARKLHLIEKVLKIKSEPDLAALEEVLSRPKSDPKRYTKAKSSFSDFLGIWTKEEASEIEMAIEDGCEKIHPDDWK